jgi:hypothetical protein
MEIKLLTIFIYGRKQTIPRKLQKMDFGNMDATFQRETGENAFKAVRYRENMGSSR